MPVAERQQMAGSDLAGAVVVQADVVHRQVGVLGGAIEADDRQAALYQRHQMLLRLQRRAEDDALHALRHERLRVFLFALGAALRVAQQDAVAALDGRFLDPACQRTEEGVGDRGHQQADHRQCGRSSAGAPTGWAGS